MDTVPEPPYADEPQRGRARDSDYQAAQSNSVGRRKTIWKKIAVASASSLGILIVWDLWWGYRSIGYTKITNKYVNHKYQYSMEIPAGWTLATQVMQSLQSRLETWWAMNLYTYKDADFVLVSRWDANVERTLSQAIDRLSLKGSPIPYAQMLTGSAILVDVSGGFDLQTARAISVRQPPTQLWGSECS
jgi:hypothetical protein